MQSFGFDIIRCAIAMQYADFRPRPQALRCVSGCAGEGRGRSPSGVYWFRRDRGRLGKRAVAPSHVKIGKFKIN